MVKRVESSKKICSSVLGKNVKSYVFAYNTTNCCGNEIGEKYVYSGGQGCCDSLDDCPTSTGVCITTGLLYPGQPQKVCRESTGSARDDWITCSSSSFANQIYSAGVYDYCCVDLTPWEWVGPFCTCDYSQSVCTGSSCGGTFAFDVFTGDPDDGSCCFGALVWKLEEVGYVAGEACGTLDSTCAPDCFCLDPPLW